jgi:hypothetical protein
MTTVTDIRFDDDLYSVELVAAINQELASDKTALQIWKACTALVYAEIGGWETDPRDYLLMVMDARETRGFATLAKRFGYVPQGAKALEPKWRPYVWTGVDAQEHFDGECPIDWEMIDEVAAELGNDPCAVYNFLCQQAIEVKQEGDDEGCSYLACQALAAMNYLLLEEV